MAAASLSFTIGIIGNIISILVFSSPIKTFLQVVKKKSTENYESIPYITTLLSTSLWTFYGLLKPGGLLISTVNGAGVVFQSIYVTLFLIYAPNHLKVKTAKLVGILNVGFLGLVIAVTLLALHGSVRLTFVGVLCAGLTVGMYASPLSAMRSVIKTKSVEYMPFFLSFFLFLNAGIWSAYAVLVQDFFIGVPNAAGVLLGSAQLILYAVYKNKSNIISTKSTEKMEEEGSAHLVKGIIQMQAFHEDDQEALKNRSLNKGTSLPKPPVNRQYSFQRLLKTSSLNPYEVHSNWAHVDDLENGEKIHP
ncbi:bidirectional sugar transporter SWEET16-like [Corylus avellana]|uniref:bidirectional sugar transporter SWEET16-like n=1 Tax=Corylus avellana TaxID=13451 RepID=UPI001E1F1C58|nr:bidirectional sugar transporter SWEET16-like [Corylus avellana]